MCFFVGLLLLMISEGFVVRLDFYIVVFVCSFDVLVWCNVLFCIENICLVVGWKWSNCNF